MKTQKHIFIFSFFIVFSLTAFSNTAVKGFIDLRDHCFSEHGTVKLRGEWEFYWKEFYSPGFIMEHRPAPDFYIRQPMSWADHKDAPVSPAVQGYATYRLSVILPKGLQKAEKAALLGIKLIECHSAYEIFINGKKYGGNGRIATCPENFIPLVRPATYPFIPVSDTLEIIVHAANFFDNNQGGIDDNVLLGDHSELIRHTQKQDAIFIIAFGILFFMAIYHLILYMLRRKERLNLYFALICIVMSVFSLWQGNKLILQYLPGMSMELYFRIWISAVGGVGLWMMFYYKLLPIEMNRKVTRVIAWFFLIHSILALLLPVSFYFRIVNFIFLAALVSIIWMFTAFVRAVINKREFAFIIFIGMLVPIATAINDALFGLDLIVTGYYAPAGFLFFLLSQSYLLSLRFSRSFRQVEILSTELEKLNTSLETIVEERTLQLTQANEELHQLNLTKDKFFSIITHDLRNPFGIIINISELLLNKEYVKGDPETERFLSLLKDAADKSYKLIENLIEWSNVQTGQILFQPVEVDLHDITEENIHLLRAGAGAKNIEIKNNIPPSFSLTADKNMLALIIRNLLTNALKYSFEGGLIEVHARKKGDKTEVVVEDNGKGIPADNLEQLFRIDKKTSEKGTYNEKGTGLGLALCKEFIKKHNGKIRVESEEGKGSRFIFEI